MFTLPFPPKHDSYSTGVREARVRGASGRPLPNVRALSGNVLIDVDDPDQQFTSSVMQWAQFLDHDFAHVPFPDMGKTFLSFLTTIYHVMSLFFGSS